jgi:hypothetical protein
MTQRFIGRINLKNCIISQRSTKLLVIRTLHLITIVPILRVSQNSLRPPSYLCVIRKMVTLCCHVVRLIAINSRSQWPRGLRRGSAAGRWLGLWVRIQPRSWICLLRVLSGRGLCVGLITRPEKSYRVWCVWAWSWSLDNEEALADQGLSYHEKKMYYHQFIEF